MVTQAYNYYYPLSWGASYVECIVSTIEQGIQTLNAFQHFSKHVFTILLSKGIVHREPAGVFMCKQERPQDHATTLCETERRDKTPPAEVPGMSLST